MGGDEGDVGRSGALVGAGGKAGGLVEVEDGEWRRLNCISQGLPSDVVKRGRPGAVVGVPIATDDGISLNAAKNGREIREVATRASRGWGAVGVDDDERGVVNGRDDALDFEIGVVGDGDVVRRVGDGVVDEDGNPATQAVRTITAEKHIVWDFGVA